MLRSKRPQGQVPGQQFIDPGVLTRIDNLELIARGVVDGFISGLHRTVQIGVSTEFAEHRAYVPGDDVRRIDWRVYARTDRLYVKSFEAETNADLVLALDASRSMDYASAGVDPAIMGIAPVPATRKLMERMGVGIDAFDLIELNEAFAAQVLACDRDLEFDRARLNVHGGAIALGHPIGCTGARIVVTLVHEMAKREANRGLATMCIGVGQGIALLVEAA